VGSAWHRHYERLHLHTAGNISELPFLHFPKSYPRFPSRKQVIDYLESYAETSQLEIRFGQPVLRAFQDNAHWIVQTRDASYRTQNLVVATGNTRQAILPTWQGQDTFRGKILHSSNYKNGEPFRGQNVLVVGFGNSGGEIAIDLWEHGAKPGIAVRGAVNVIPREVFGIPSVSISILQNKLPARVADAINAPLVRLTIGDITKYGLRKLPYGPVTQARRDGHIPLIDVGTIRLIRDGHLAVYPGIQEFTEDGVKFVDERPARFDAVILATGYRPRVNEFLQASDVYDNEGVPLTTGCESSQKGLYFCGFYVSPTGMLREIAMEARQISNSIAVKKRSISNVKLRD
jgi:cation diffusion facilitator CzcD-associated flavoprotein CzcO